MNRSRLRVGRTNLDGGRSRAITHSVELCDSPTRKTPSKDKKGDGKGKDSKEEPPAVKPPSFPARKKNFGFTDWALLKTEGAQGGASSATGVRRHSYGDPVSLPVSPPTESTQDGLSSNLAALRRCRHKLSIYQGGVKKYFLSWCNDRNGHLSRADMAAGFKELNLGFDDAENDFLVKVFDKDKSNSVEYSEFCQTMELTDAEIMKEAGLNSIIQNPSWTRPPGWHFNPLQKRKAKELREEMKKRIHLTFGSDPRAIREAFLFMDHNRVGLLSKEDVQKAMSHIGMRMQGPDLDLLMSYYDNERRDGGVSYNAFVEHFEPEPVGSFNPFDPSSTLKPRARGGAPDSGHTEKWMHSFGRDQRYKTMFPDLYRSPVRADSAPPDFSSRIDTVDFQNWKHHGKVVGKQYLSLDHRKPLPTRGLKVGSDSGLTGMQARSLDASQADFTARRSASSLGEMRVTMADPVKSKEELVRDKDRRFKQRQKEVAKHASTVAESNSKKQGKDSVFGAGQSTQLRAPDAGGQRFKSPQLQKQGNPRLDNSGNQ